MIFKAQFEGSNKPYINREAIEDDILAEHGLLIKLGWKLVYTGEVQNATRCLWKRNGQTIMTSVIN